MIISFLLSIMLYIYTTYRGNSPITEYLQIRTPYLISVTIRDIK